jgi:hypothetical protein
LVERRVAKMADLLVGWMADYSDVLRAGLTVGMMVVLTVEMKVVSLVDS